MEAEEYPSGTSTAVGPSFFVGQITAVRWNRGFREAASILHRLGWVCLGTAALFVVAALEWQTWRPSTLVARREMVAAAQGSAQSGSHADAQALYPAVPNAAAPSSASMTKASATVVVPAIPAMSDVAETLSISSTTRKVQPAENEADRENELDNDSTKVKLLRTAMSRGDADAPVSLANLYLEGKEVSRSCDQAVSLLESAAAKANARARNRLAAMYEIGTCVERDRVQAYRWLSAALAVDHDNVWAQENLDQTWREMTPEERTMAEAYR